MSKRAGGSVREAARRRAQPAAVGRPDPEPSRIVAWREQNPGQPLPDELVQWLAAMERERERAADPLAQLAANRYQLERAEQWRLQLLADRDRLVVEAREAGAGWAEISDRAGVARPTLVQRMGSAAG